jgi:hypothetical protein
MQSLGNLEADRRIADSVTCIREVSLWRCELDLEEFHILGTSELNLRFV